MPIRPSRVVVHIGNVGLSLEGRSAAQETEHEARRNPRDRFIGIDRKEHVPALPNWSQRTGELLEKINELADGSIDEFSSRMTIPYVAFRTMKNLGELKDYNRSVIALIYRKLRSGGKLEIMVHEGRPMKISGIQSARDIMADVLHNSGFRNVVVRRVPGKVAGRKSQSASRILEAAADVRFYKFVAEK